LRTRAVHTGDVYLVSGEKCWTSDAHHADFLWLLCRTGTQESRGRGLTILILDMATPGVTVTPIETIDGHRLNQVFLEEVEVAETERVGNQDGAWGIIRDALAVERHLQLLPGRLRRDVTDLRTALEERGLLDCSGVAAERWAGLAARTAQVEACALATLDALQSGRSGVAEAARTKLLGSELAQDIPRTALDLLGLDGLEESATPMPFLWKQSIMETIAGGANEILLGLLARECLGIAASG
jgi:alkylation response protein AidB-like acyl-CoA dehydrogenase